MSVRVSLIAGAIAMAVSSSAQAQTPGQPNLADVARKGEAARADGAVKKATKSYTNKDLKAIPQLPAAEQAAAAPASAAQAKEEAAEAKAAPPQAAKPEEDVPPREEMWRLRAKRFRDQVTQVQSRLAKLVRESENKDPAREQKRIKDIAELRVAIGVLQNQWNDFEKSARDAKVDVSWLEPAPQFQQ